jgi:hypothetical protein
LLAALLRPVIDYCQFGCLFCAGYLKMPLSFQKYCGFVVAVVCSLSINGCALTQANNTHNNPADYTATNIIFLPGELTARLQQAQSGQQLPLSQSPWGSNVTLYINTRYFSAAGKPCIDAQVMDSAQTQTVVLCQYQQQRWGATRALTKLLAQ